MSELSMNELGAMPTHSSNGRPMDSHVRQTTTQFARDNHIEHVRDFDALCMVCGCCWCCEDDCCAEYVCPNPECGCNDKPASVPTVAAPTEAGDER